MPVTLIDRKQHNPKKRITTIEKIICDSFTNIIIISLMLKNKIAINCI